MVMVVVVVMVVWREGEFTQLSGCESRKTRRGRVLPSAWLEKSASSQLVVAGPPPFLASMITLPLSQISSKMSWMEKKKGISRCVAASSKWGR